MGHEAGPVHLSQKLTVYFDSAQRRDSVRKLRLMLREQGESMRQGFHPVPSQMSRNMLRRTLRAKIALFGDGENAESQDYKSSGELSSNETPSLRLNNQRIPKEAP